jgi:hypothetical protein
MNWANPALWIAISGLVTAIGTLIGVIAHVNQHTPPG